MGGNQVPGMGSGDDGYDEEGYDESQRAEILEVPREGPTAGLILTDLDLGDDEDGDPVLMEEDDDAEPTDRDSDLRGAARSALEDPIHDSFDADEEDEDEPEGDAEEDALEP